MNVVSVKSTTLFDQFYGALSAWFRSGQARGLHPVLLRRNALLWAIIVPFLALQIPLVYMSPFTIAWHEAGKVAVSFAAIAAASVLFLHRYQDPVLGLGCSTYVQMTSLSIFGIGYTYLAAWVAMPLQDDLFMAMDRALGLDWMALMRWTIADPLRVQIQCFAYASLPTQVMFVVPILVLCHRFHTIQVMIAAWLISVVVTILVFIFLPGVSTFQHLGIVEDMRAVLPNSGGFSHLEHLMAAREGLHISLYEKPQGMVPFPSFHTCSAVILMWAFWHASWLRWPAVILNVMMIAATPIIGSHYFVDIFAGLALAIGALTLANRLMPDPGPDTTRLTA